jgi:hypothetical protein
MTVARLISPAGRTGLLVTLGVVLINVPIVAGMSAAAFAVGVLLGGLAFGLGLAGTSDGRRTLSPTAIADFDRGLTVGLLVAAGAFAAVGEMVAVVMFGSAALVALIVAGFSRYATSPAY